MECGTTEKNDNSMSLNTKFVGKVCWWDNFHSGIMEILLYYCEDSTSLSLMWLLSIRIKY